MMMMLSISNPSSVAHPLMEADPQARLEEAQHTLQEHMAGVLKAMAVVKALRTPETGCPWDLEQNHHSLRKHMLEEAYEAVEAMETNSPSLHLKEELGDVLLQVLLHAQIAEDAGSFTFEDVCEGLAEKLIRRHPHVFQPSKQLEVNTPEAVSEQWQRIKALEVKPDSLDKPQHAQASTMPSVLEGVSQGQPALSRAGQVSHKAVKAGFNWPDDATLMECVRSELREIEDEMRHSPTSADRLEDEMGDVLFACASLAKHLRIEPELALSRATDKFEQRFQYMEGLIHASGTPMQHLSFEEWEAYWQQAKAELRSKGLCR
jgi:nucleoside triphosphate diphosphatase